MKRRIFGLTVAISTVVLTTFPVLSQMVNKAVSSRTNTEKYQATKLDNSMDAMLDPERGGIRPMPAPPPWIPPVEKEINDKMPPADIPKLPSYGNYTPMRHLPRSVPWMIPPTEDEGQLRDIPSYQIR